MNRYDEALVYMEKAARGMPDHPRVLYNLGLLLQQQGRLPEAEEALQRALDLEPASFDFLFALADHYAKRGEFRKALPLAERMVSLQPGNAAARDMKARIEAALQGAGSG
jgi:tetratricopeptide (TPR) repeat protein